jgi:hypothetical protein
MIVDDLDLLLHTLSFEVTGTTFQALKILAWLDDTTTTIEATARRALQIGLLSLLEEEVPRHAYMTLKQTKREDEEQDQDKSSSGGEPPSDPETTSSPKSSAPIGLHRTIKRPQASTKRPIQADKC